MTGPDEHLELPGLVRDKVAEGRAKAQATRRRKQAEQAVAEIDPVARVLVDVPLPHLDRPFDYAVPAVLADEVRPGVRVKVRFAGQDVDGFVVSRQAHSDHPGQLTPLRRLVSPEPVLTPEVARLVDAVAERYAGVRFDVLRLAVPPRHATTEAEPSPPAPQDPSWSLGVAEQAWSAYPAAGGFLRRLHAGESPRAVWAASPGDDWPLLLAHAAGAAHGSHRGVVCVVPDGKDVARVDRALCEVLGADHHVVLTAEGGPARRYRDFLAVSRGARRVALGTRAAAFAPVSHLGLVVLWDDGDDLLAEPRAPYPHARETLLMRAEQAGAAVLVGGFGRSVEAQMLLATGWAKALEAPRATVRERAHITVAGASDHELARDPHLRAARLPHTAHETVSTALQEGPVLVLTPRAGYVLALACERCRTPCRCVACAGPLELSGPSTPPVCRWCGTADEAWTCPECGGRGLRAPVVGDTRTRDELGRAFPSVRVRTSSGERVLTEVADEPAIVVATPGAEPVAASGYSAVLLLDTWLLLARADLRAAEEALRRWSNAAGLVRPGGRVLAVGDPAHPALQALVRWGQPGFAEREIEERRAAHLPPASRVATITGSPGAVDDAATLLGVPDGAELLGPVPAGDDEERLVVRVPRARGAALSRALWELQRARAGRKLDPVRVQVDPLLI